MFVVLQLLLNYKGFYRLKRLNTFIKKGIIERKIRNITYDW